MRSFYLLCICAFGLPVAAQHLDRSVVGSAGSFVSVADVGDLHFTVGELAVARTSAGMALERGFHHGFTALSTSVWTAGDVQLTLSVYPNPTPDLATLSGNWEAGDLLTVSDLHGRPLHRQTLPPDRTGVRLDGYPAGVYVLTIHRHGRPIGGLRLLRQ
ncbi:hypothetical protein LEM8419_01889 [Neolewinella maritima]|uniref:T9SS type A sorting domain-containing protein n=1 Tax=Neolewinella maritima TaxID=1383882 RepID=A0ABM9B1P8_9BACT|nr:T9SS type A sorting domain-containing protein [Neolewinella maritima]CAH1000797.1 hypothetical protein LEM8419_01889 [Neolewinella maritima]